jgi:rod shape-determining protein MreC
VAAAVKSGRARPSEIEDLRWRVKVLERTVVRLSDEAADRERLVRELTRLGEIPSVARWGFIPADIVGTDASSWGGVVEIDAGSANGVLPGSGVVSDGAVFGTVEDVRTWTSTVRTISDPKWRAAGLLLEKRVRGVVGGNGKGNCTVSFVVTEQLISAKETVVTSGTDGMFPEGILIGVVTGCSWEKKGLGVCVQVKPAADAEYASGVVVLKALP